MIHVLRIQEMEMSEPSWLLYEKGNFRRPLAILTEHEFQRLIREHEEQHPFNEAHAEESHD